MGVLHVALLLSFVGLTFAACAPSAAADPTVCGPWNGNQAIKSRTCVDPERAPHCPLYTEYYTGLHYGVICWGVPSGVGDPRDPLGDLVPLCSSPSTVAFQAWICYDPSDPACTVSIDYRVLSEYQPRECVPDPSKVADVAVAEPDSPVTLPEPGPLPLPLP